MLCTLSAQMPIVNVFVTKKVIIFNKFGKIYPIMLNNTQFSENLDSEFSRKRKRRKKRSKRV